MLRETSEVINELGIYSKNMLKNMNNYGGVVFSQRVLLALVENGINREEAYRLVQKHAHAAWNTEDGDFRANLNSDKSITEILSLEQLDSCFSTETHQSNLDVIWERLKI